MRKSILVLAILILFSGILYAQEDVIPIRIVEFPLPASARTYQIGEYRSFVEMDRPFMGDGFSCKFAPFTSGNITDYPVAEGEALVFKQVINVEKTESIGTVFFTAYFQYTICQDGAEPVVHNFNTVGNGTTDEEALDKCFRNGAIHVSEIAGSISARPAPFTVSSIVSGEYVLSCGKKDKA